MEFKNLKDFWTKLNLLTSYFSVKNVSWLTLHDHPAHIKPLVHHEFDGRGENAHLKEEHCKF
jgi:hypothetical protein